jgi:choline transport protein
MTSEVAHLDDGLDRDHALLHEGTLKRNIGVMGIIGIGLSIVNGWVAMSSTIVIGLGSGGTAVILFGVIGESIHPCVRF